LIMQPTLQSLSTNSKAVLTDMIHYESYEYPKIIRDEDITYKEGGGCNIAKASSLLAKEDIIKFTCFGGATYAFTKRIMIESGGEVKTLIRVKDSEVIIDMITEAIDLERRIEEWAKMALSIEAEPFPEESEKLWDWMDEEYARRKLGLPPRRSC